MPDADHYRPSTSKPVIRPVQSSLTSLERTYRFQSLLHAYPALIEHARRGMRRQGIWHAVHMTDREADGLDSLPLPLLATVRTCLISPLEPDALRSSLEGALYECQEIEAGRMPRQVIYGPAHLSVSSRLAGGSALSA